jgi:hypothetical protein
MQTVGQVGKAQVDAWQARIAPRFHAESGRFSLPLRKSGFCWSDCRLSLAKLQATERAA